MKQFKEILTLAVISALLALTLAACGGGNPNNSGASAPSASFPSQNGGAAGNGKTDGTKQSGGDTAQTRTDSGNVSDTGGSLNPPDWLIGSWTLTGDAEVSGEKTSVEDLDLELDVDVTAHNVSVSSGKLNFSEQIEKYELNVTEETDGDAYILNYSTGNLGYSYTFMPEGGGMKCTITIADNAVAYYYAKK